MNSTLLSPEDVADLGITLRNAGYNVGPDQCIAAQRLLVTLAAEGPRFTDRRGLRTWLGPIFCSSPTEQEDFATHYGDWLERNGEPRVPGASHADTVPAPIVKGPGATSRSRRAIAALIVATGLIGALLVAYQITRELRGRSASGSVTDYNGKPVPEVTLSFRGNGVAADPEGRFKVSFRLLDLPAKLSARDKFGFEDSLELNSENYQSPIALRVGSQPIPQPPSAPVSLRSLELTADEVDFLKKTPYVPPPTQQQPTQPPWQLFYRRHYRQLFAAAASIPFLLTLLWILWKHLPRLQLIRWRSQDKIQLDALRVKGSDLEFFNSPGFRRIAQQLRRHRSVESTDLDPDGTVVESASRGGWFTPVYLWQKRLPDYLILIDRAGFRDFQGRLVDDLVDNLRLGKVEIDCYDFYADPRSLHQSVRKDSFTPKQRTPEGPSGNGDGASASFATAASILAEEPRPVTQAPLRRFSLEDLLAKHPSHNVLIFSDASGFFSPLSGKLHAWVNNLAQWTFRALLVPEEMLARKGEGRTQDLEDAGFLLLPATEKGLAAAVDVLDGVGVERVDLVGLDGDGDGSYPDLLRADDLRWLSDIGPRASQVSLLIGQLRAYLGQEAFSWLCACAIYPELLWDLTLYLGHDLRLLGADEQRLRLLLRLPWFRYGNIPNWLRERLTDVMPAADREAVRAALWRLLGTALEKPLHGFELSYAKDDQKTAASRLKAGWLKRLVMNFIQTEQPESALRDYVFLSVLRGRKPQKGLPVPEALRKLWGRFGQPRRPAIQVAAGLLATAAVSAAMYHYRPVPPRQSIQPLPAGAYVLPRPTGPAPYHFSLNQVVGDQRIKDAESAGALVFQVTGDTGGVKNPTPQESVAAAMMSQFGPSDSAYNPAFLYLLGDLIYYNGEAKDYSAQFYDPYRGYRAPILAIPGNHDGDPLVGSRSLDAFVRNFCAANVYRTPEAGDVDRAAMRQPNSYWTLETPFATIIGLYTNVPDRGFVDYAQQAWLVAELKNAPSNKALIVAMHHPVYSAANTSDEGAYLSGVLDHAIAVAGRAPDLVLAAHVNNYQRFTRVLPGGRAIPYIVAGGGGYFNLRRLPASTTVPHSVSPDVTLNAYEDKRHGFLRLTSSSTLLKGEYFAVYESSVPISGSALVDDFTIQLSASTVPSEPRLPNTAGTKGSRALPRPQKPWEIAGSVRTADGMPVVAGVVLDGRSIAPGFLAAGSRSAPDGSFTITAPPGLKPGDAVQFQVLGERIVSPPDGKTILPKDSSAPIILVVSPTSTSADNGLTRSQVEQLLQPVAPNRRGGYVFDNWNSATVENSPQRPTTFALTQASMVTRISDYHWNDKKGAFPGKGSIGLRGLDGKNYGSWPVATSSGQDGAPNVNWECTPNITLPAGTYEVVDPDPSTWSQNGRSGNAGFSRIEGYVAESHNAMDTTSTASRAATTPAPVPSSGLRTRVDGGTSQSAQSAAPTASRGATYPAPLPPTGLTASVDGGKSQNAQNAQNAAPTASRAAATQAPLPPTGLTASVDGGKNAQNAVPSASRAATTSAPLPPAGLTAVVSGGGSQGAQSARGKVIVLRPDGKFAAEAMPDGRIVIRSTQDQLERVVLKPASQADDLEWSPDGTKLASHSDFHIYVWEGQRGALLMTLNDSERSLREMVWSPDSVKIALVAPDGEVRVRNVSRSDAPVVTLASRAGILGVTWSTDSKHLQAADSNGRFITWDATTGQEVRAGK